MKVNFVQKGSYTRFERFLTKALHFDAIVQRILDKYGKRGVEALREATPKDSGTTADSWRYELVKGKNGWSIVWHNDNIQNGVNIAILIQYGHATRNGGYVQGIDYINPSIQHIFGQISDEAWKEVNQAYGRSNS